MNWEFVFLNLLVISLGSLIYIVIRVLPRLDERPVKRGAMERWLTSDLPTRMDSFFRTIYLRTLRRIRVLVLKADNSINQKLESIKLEREPIPGATRVDLESLSEKAADGDRSRGSANEE